jgi:hypothetical protein
VNFEFINQHGEKFVFEQASDSVYKFKGDETEWNLLYMVNGYCPQFNFSEYEMQQISKNIELIKPPVYEYKKGKGTCPICLTNYTFKSSHNHHAIAASVGGSDRKPNIIRICKNCHGLETFGNDDKAKPINLASKYYQIYIHGIEFFLCQLHPSSRFKGRHIKYYDKGTWNIIKSYYKAFGVLKLQNKPLDTLEEVNKWLKRLGGDSYLYWQQVYFGNIPFNTGD